MTETDYLWGRRSGILLRALTNRFYYQERQRIFELREGGVRVVSILGGSVAFANIAYAVIIQYCAAAIAITSAASLVFGFGSKARDSLKRSEGWALLERDIERVGERSFNEEQVNEWTARCNEMEAGEPVQHPGLLERSYLRACAVLDSAPTSDAGWWARARPAIIVH